MIPSTVRICVCDQPQDMRRSLVVLALAAQEQLGQDPRSGAMFVFVNKRRDRLKALWLDKNGYCLLYKRLHRARFELPGERAIDGRTLATLLIGVENARYHPLRP
jgi:transposase